MNRAVALMFLMLSLSANAQIRPDQIQQIIADKRATVGVAILFNDDRIITINNDECYPTQSVFKFHIAIAALKKMEQENTSLDRIVNIQSSQLRLNTYSPLRDKYPNQNVQISYRDLIRYTVSLSDNNTCDLLIEFLGGINNVVSCIKQLGIEDFSFSETENSMHENIYNCYNNWSTPSSMVHLLKKAYTEHILDDYYLDFLKQVMIQTPHGANKIKAGLPGNIIFGHKTGHSDRTESGVKIGDNDAGVVYLPNGDQYYIAIFIKDSEESDSVNAEIMAAIAKGTYDAIITQ